MLLAISFPLLHFPNLPKADPRIILRLHHYMTRSTAECMRKELDGKKGIAAFGSKTIWRSSSSSASLCKKWGEVCTIADQTLVQHSSVIDQQLVNMKIAHHHDVWSVFERLLLTFSVDPQSKHFPCALDSSHHLMGTLRRGNLCSACALMFGMLCVVGHSNVFVWRRGQYSQHAP